jgi:hypothetical protein
MRTFTVWLAFAGLAAAQDRALVKEYETQRAKLGEKDASAHFRLGAWAASKGLPDLAEKEFEHVVGIDPNHKGARDRLGYKKVKNAWEETPERTRRLRLRKLVDEGLQLPPREELDKAAAKDRHALKVIEFAGWKESWIAALGTVDANTGLVGDAFKVDVSLGALPEGQVAQASGSNGQGRVVLDVDRWAATLRQQEDFERREKEGTFKIRVPALGMNATLAHELTHCFQGGSTVPWVTEGMACYATKDPFYYFYFTYFKGAVAEIDKTSTDQNLHYGRGMAFFEFFEKKFGVPKTKEFIRLLVEKAPPEEAAAKVTGRAWAEIVREEAAWSSKHVATFKK